VPHDEIGPQPTPVTEPGDPNPGGVDAIDDTGSLPIPADLGPDANPAVDDIVPDEISELDEEKSQSPEGSAGDQEAGAQPAPQAGQEDETGGVEPPA
jgi:hypothetical protein